MVISNPRYNSHGTIDVTIDHPTFGVIEFTSSPSDSEDHGRDIYANALNGEYGEVVEYIEPGV